MGKLHELIAVENDLQTAAKQMAEDAKNTFAKKADHFRGQIRTVTFFSEAREGENTSEEKAMVTTVDEKLDYALRFISKYYDAILRKEAANQHAVADLTVDGVTLMKDVPATFLLGMEHRLKDLRDVFLAIPTLEPAIKWQDDPSKGAGVFSAPPTATMKTEKIIEPLVLAPATDKHPAQVKETSTDRPVARIETHITSGMWTPARKALAVEKIDTLIKAVKKARQRANSVEVPDVNIAKRMMEYILGSGETLDKE